MVPTQKPQRQRPYSIRERLFEFASDVVRAAQILHTRGGIGRVLSAQLVSAAVSAAANAEEADDASSRRDFLAKERISLRELKETRLRLRVLLANQLLDESGDELIKESQELIKIMSAILHKASHTEAPPVARAHQEWGLDFGIWVLGFMSYASHSWCT